MVSDIVSLLSAGICINAVANAFVSASGEFTVCSQIAVRTMGSERFTFFLVPGSVRPGSVASAVDAQLFEERIVVRLSSEEVMEESHPVLGAVRLEDRSPIGHANR